MILGYLKLEVFKKLKSKLLGCSTKTISIAGINWYNTGKITKIDTNSNNVTIKWDFIYIHRPEPAKNHCVTRHYSGFTNTDILCKRLIKKTGTIF